MAAIAIPRLGGFRADAVEAADEADAAVVYKALSSYYAANGNLADFALNQYIDKNVTYTGGKVSGNEITPVTVNGQTYPQ